MQFHGEELGEFVEKVFPLEVASFPAEETPSCWIGEHDPSIAIEENGAIRHGGDERGLFHLRGLQFLDVGCVVNLQLGSHGVEAIQQFAKFTAHGEADASAEVAIGDRAHAAKQLLHRSGDGEGVEHGPQDHQHPDGDEHRHRHLPGEGRARESRFVGVHPEGQHTQIAVLLHKGNEHIGDQALGGDVLPHQWILGAVPHFRGQFQASIQAEITI